jgi:hypothetical protein
MFVGIPAAEMEAPGRFPGVTFPVFPNRQQRIDALRELGYAPVSLDAWRWKEEDEDDTQEYGVIGLLSVVALVPAEVKA